ncbi:hypothetical protein B0A56_09120 [Flavobacterium columnare NBRC 100251 = ATCC 23463]|nr:hypothetical protein B0A56_09120 [Flavobacterium columnare NBRC 100251 = ATCC 23463]
MLIPYHLKEKIKFFRIFLQFYKRVIFIDICISIPILIFCLNYFAFLFFYCTIGLFLSFVYFEHFENHYYYFYFNLGFTKTKLIISSFILNFLISITLIIIIKNVS